MSWQDQTLEIWAKRWSNYNLSLPPSYDLDIKMKCIKDHGIKAGVFTLKSLRNLRISNHLNYKTYKQYSHAFPLAISYSKTSILALIFFPKTTYHIFSAMKKFAKVRNLFSTLFGVKF
jgi:hypothetical protein